VCDPAPVETSRFFCVCGRACAWALLCGQHRLEDLDVVVPMARRGPGGARRPIMWLVGDSSLDNKHWLLPSRDTQNACNGSWGRGRGTGAWAGRRARRTSGRGPRIATTDLATPIPHAVPAVIDSEDWF
jgi:hypothetical protein